MPKADPERLAAALRANLHRRKAQSRAIARQGESTPLSSAPSSPPSPAPSLALSQTPERQDPTDAPPD